MKKFLIVLTLALQVLTLAFLVINKTQNKPVEPAGNLYPTSGTIVGIDRENDIATFSDEQGRLFSFYGVEDWHYDDHLAAIMNDCGTESVFDDEIISLRYCG